MYILCIFIIIYIYFISKINIKLNITKYFITNILKFLRALKCNMFYIIKLFSTIFELLIFIRSYREIFKYPLLYFKYFYIFLIIFNY